MRRTVTAPKGWNRSRINSASKVFEPVKFPFVITTFWPSMVDVESSPAPYFAEAHLQSKPVGPMSALGQKQTYALQQAMSALHPIATEKADFRKRSCPLYSQKRTCAVQLGMSAMGHKRTLTLAKLRAAIPLALPFSGLQFADHDRQAASTRVASARNTRNSLAKLRLPVSEPCLPRRSDQAVREPPL